MIHKIRDKCASCYSNNVIHCASDKEYNVIHTHVLMTINVPIPADADSVKERQKVRGVLDNFITGEKIQTINEHEWEKMCTELYKVWPKTCIEIFSSFCFVKVINRLKISTYYDGRSKTINLHFQFICYHYS